MLLKHLLFFEPKTLLLGRNLLIQSLDLADRHVGLERALPQRAPQAVNTPSLLSLFKFCLLIRTHAKATHYGLVDFVGNVRPSRLGVLGNLLPILTQQLEEMAQLVGLGLPLDLERLQRQV